MKRHYNRSIVFAILFALLLPAFAAAKPGPRTPPTIRDQILKHGVGAWVCVEEKNGLLLAGRITGLDEDSFGMQLHNYPEVTVVFYSDVVRVRQIGISGKTAAILVGATVAVGVVMALIAHHEFEQNKAKMPTLPTLP